jgi:REP element-mobilizing transposase RayT
MARANRHYLPGNHIWHITHRCHKKEFLLKFARDRRTWLKWLFEAKKRYGLCVLNYMVTSNHIHLLVEDRGEGMISRSIQLIAGRTAQDYNRRKKRKGAFWEDRYQATAVQADSHFVQCMIYIDLNMVRAGVVRHPSEWSFCGHNEIQSPPQRYSIIDRKRLMELVGAGVGDELSETYKEWIDEILMSGETARENRWTESVAVGNIKFIRTVREKLGIRAAGRDIIESGASHELREPGVSYSYDFEVKNGILSPENTYFWDF